MKTLVTHINPHLDDILGIWLFKRFHPDFKDAKIEFISASRDATSKAENQDKVFVGTGGGPFDEHKEGLIDCAGSLVYKFLINQGFIPQDDKTKRALDELIKWNKLIDTGKAPKDEFEEFSVPAFLRPKDNNLDSSLKAMELGEQILDRILAVLQRQQQSLIDFEKRLEFDSAFGKAVAVVSETVDREFCRKYGGANLYLIYDPKFKSVQFFTPSFEIDLGLLYKKLKEKDSEASWFLHQSHHMILCGAGAAPEFTPTKLNFEELMEEAK